MINIHNKSRTHFHIIGGGVAGLALAIALSRNQIKSTVYEKSTRDNFAGMGFLLANNGVEALTKLIGLGALDNCGVQLDEMKLIDYYTGHIVSRVPSNGMIIRRPDLIKILEDHCRSLGVCIYFNYELESAQTNNDSQSMILNFKDHTKGLSCTVQATQVIGADGIHSIIRRSFFPTSQLTAPQITEFVGMCDDILDINQQHKKQLIKRQRADHKQSFGCAPLGTDKLIWYAQLPLISEQFANKIDQKKYLIHQYKNWPDPLIQTIQQTDLDLIYRWDNSDLNLLPKPYNEGVLLIGDAAHASLTISSQGVSSALVDSVTLSELTHGQMIDQGSIDWIALCESFVKIRGPVWSTQQNGARSLLAEYLLKGNGSVPCIL